ncbi:MAG: (2Fe-2S)-binding protein [Spirochaetota bacterium]|nr:MAG: (2Fe-2S)-binding protein [Spirochaetota bacterium]
MRVYDHPILGKLPDRKEITILVDGKKIKAYEDETIATAILASGIKTLRYTSEKHEPRGIFCAIGQCTDCVMEVNGQPNVRTCITPVEENMVIATQQGLGTWRKVSSKKK